MALTIYPNTGYDTFCLLADAETLILNNIPSSQHATWDALLDADKEILLRQSTLIISGRITLPDALEDALQLATAYLANFSAGVNMVDTDGKSNIKVKDIVGVVKTEYFSRSKENNALPDIVEMLLKPYSIVSINSFEFSRA